MPRVPLSSSELWEAQIDVSASQVLLVELILGSLGLLLALEEDKGVTRWPALVHVDRDVAFSHSEVLEEIANFTHLDREGKTSHLQSRVAVLLVDKV